MTCVFRTLANLSRSGCFAAAQRRGSKKRAWTEATALPGLLLAAFRRVKFPDGDAPIHAASVDRQSLRPSPTWQASLPGWHPCRSRSGSTRPSGGRRSPDRRCLQRPTRPESAQRHGVAAVDDQRSGFGGCPPRSQIRPNRTRKSALVGEIGMTGGTVPASSLPGMCSAIVIGRCARMLRRWVAASLPR